MLNLLKDGDGRNLLDLDDFNRLGRSDQSLRDDGRQRSWLRRVHRRWLVDRPSDNRLDGNRNGLEGSGLDRDFGNGNLDEGLPCEFLFELLEIHLVDVGVLFLGHVHFMHKGLFGLDGWLLGNICVCQLDGIHPHFLFVGHFRLRSEGLHSGRGSLSVLDQSDVVEVGFLVGSSFLRDEELLGVLSEGGVGEASVGFRVLDALTHCTLVSRIGLEVNVVPETRDFHTAVGVAIQPHRLAFESDFDELLAGSGKDMEQQRVAIPHSLFVANVETLQDRSNGLLRSEQVSMLQLLNVL
jgi:hypothetical protein